MSQHDSVRMATRSRCLDVAVTRHSPRCQRPDCHLSADARDGGDLASIRDAARGIGHVNGSALIVVALAVVLVGGYAVGGVLNARRLRALVTALREALAGPAGPPTVQRLGRSIVRLTAERPVRGTGSTVATVRMAPRDAVLLWVLSTLRGRGDLLDMKADLDRVPAGAGLVANPRHRTGRAALQAAVMAGGSRRDLPGCDLAMVTYDAAGAAAMERVAAIAGETGDVVVLELRGAQPRLTLLISLRRAPQSLVALRTALQGVVDATLTKPA